MGEANVGFSQGSVIGQASHPGKRVPLRGTTVLQYDMVRAMSLVIDLGASDPLLVDQIALFCGLRYKVVTLVTSVLLHAAPQAAGLRWERTTYMVAGAVQPGISLRHASPDPGGCAGFAAGASGLLGHDEPSRAPQSFQISTRVLVRSTDFPKSRELDT